MVHAYCVCDVNGDVIQRIWISLSCRIWHLFSDNGIANHIWAENWKNEVILLNKVLQIQNKITNVTMLHGRIN